MAAGCAETFAQLSQALGFSCSSAGGIFKVRNPFQLENWTLPVLEFTIVAGAVLMLVVAIKRYRRVGDPTQLVLWFGATAYLFIIEPPLYFPAAFGIENHVDTMFAHNVFTVEFLWGRLPLYIVAIYPLMATMAYEIIRMLGIFKQFGAVVGAICMGFVHHAFYEIFDHLGPQLRWWEWSLENSLNKPFLAAVPISSIVVFAALWPTSLAFWVYRLVGRPIDESKTFTGRQLVGRTFAIGLLGSLGTFILPLPATVFGANSDTARGIIYLVELAILSAVALYFLVRQVRSLRSASADVLEPNWIVLGYCAGYLAVMGIFWITALPDYFAATSGLTGRGDPIGNGWYALGCFGIAAALVLLPLLLGRRLFKIAR